MSYPFRLPLTPDKIRKPTSSPLSKDKILQLWVEHGARISARSAVLISRVITSHTAAKSAKIVASLDHIVPLPTAQASPFGNVSSSPSLLAQRRQVRELRKQYVAELERKEAEERKARDQKEAQLQEQKKRNERERALQAQEVERREAEARALEKQAADVRQAQQKEAEEKRKSAAAAESDAKKSQPASTNAVADTNIFGNGTSKGGDTKLADKAPVPQETSAKAAGDNQVPAVTQIPNGLQVPIITKGKAKEAGVTDKILECDGTPSDISRIVQEWNKICDEAEPFRRDPSMKKPRLEVKKQVNLVVNQIAASVKQVTINVNNLCQVLSHAVRGGGPAGEAFAMKEIAQRLINEADGSVALSRTAAFAVGAVIVGVSAGVRNPLRMRDVFLGAFYKHSMYVIPAYSVRGKGESVEEYRLRIGYKDEETAESYMERSCGCISLFAAVLQTEKVLGPAQSRGNASNPFSLDLGWTWLARITNREQRAITPAITFAFLEIAGYIMSKRYRRQFAKLMAVVQQVVVMKAARSAPKGPTSRMDSLIDEFVAAGCLFPEAPNGSVLPAKDTEFL